MENLDTFSTVLFVDECLMDEERTRAFENAIQNTVKKGDVVVDAGTGSGILALFSARAGAEKVYGVEVDKASAALARKSIQANPDGDKIEVVVADARSFTLPKAADVVTMELMDTGLISEQQAVVMNALRKSGVIDGHTKIIPSKVICVAELVSYDFDFYGFHMPLVMQARNNGVDARVTNYFSEKTPYQNIDFSEIVNTSVSSRLKITPIKDGEVNAIRLTTQTFLTPNIAVWGTSDMNMPVVIPIKPTKVKAGEDVNIFIQYEMGKGFDHFSLVLE